MKKIFAILVLFSMIFSLTACGSDKKSEKPASEAKKIEEIQNQNIINKENEKLNPIKQRVEEYVNSIPEVKTKFTKVSIENNGIRVECYYNARQILNQGIVTNDIANIIKKIIEDNKDVNFTIIKFNIMISNGSIKNVVTYSEGQFKRTLNQYRAPDIEEFFYPEDK